jgi:hypothetical protein
MGRWDRAGAAPDIGMNIKADSTTIASLRDAVRQLELEELARTTLDNNGFEEDWYINRRHLPTLEGNLHKSGGGNIWIYSAVTFKATAVEFERGYGGYGDDADTGASRDEALILSTLIDSGFEIESWFVWVGGQGYGGHVPVKGDNVASLAEYLATD